MLCVDAGRGGGRGAAARSHRDVADNKFVSLGPAPAAPRSIYVTAPLAAIVFPIKNPHHQVASATMPKKKGKQKAAASLSKLEAARQRVEAEERADMLLPEPEVQHSPRAAAHIAALERKLVVAGAALASRPHATAATGPTPSKMARTAEAMVTCAVCYDLFGESVGRIPRLLKCSHTFCESCLGRMADGATYNAALSQFCRHPLLYPVANLGHRGE